MNSSARFNTASPSPTAEARSVAILATGHSLPAREILSEDLDQRLGHPAGTVLRESGVARRFHADPTETAASLAARAARTALDRCAVELEQIDCLVAASGTADLGLPFNAALVHAELGLPSTTIAFDIGASCLSFIAALDTLSWPIASGRYRRVLLVSADLPSCGLDWHNLGSSAIFGDGGAAAILGPTEPGASSAILASGLRTFSQGVELCQVPGGGTRWHPSRIDQQIEPLMRFRMDGRRLFKLASQSIEDFLDDLLDRANTPREAIDWIVPHQASHLGMEHMQKRLRFPAERFVNIYQFYGNQVAASLPTALDIAIRDRRIRRGHRVLLIGTGAGLVLGGAVLEY